MSYYRSAILRAPFDEVVERTEAALKKEGFGVISRIDIQDTLKTKIGVDFRPYTILGACNPSLAYEALKIEDKVGTMLPCNVVVQAKSCGETEVAAIDPVASMQAVDNPGLDEAAREIQGRLFRMIDRLQGAAYSASALPLSSGCLTSVYRRMRSIAYSATRRLRPRFRHALEDHPPGASRDTRISLGLRGPGVSASTAPSRRWLDRRRRGRAPPLTGNGAALLGIRARFLGPNCPLPIGLGVQMWPSQQ